MIDPLIGSVNDKLFSIYAITAGNSTPVTTTGNVTGAAGQFVYNGMSSKETIMPNFSTGGLPAWNFDITHSWSWRGVSWNKELVTDSTNPN